MGNLTLATARSALWKHASNVAYSTATTAEKLEVDNVINQVIERFLTSGKWRGTVARATFNVFNEQITLPTSLQTILGAMPVTADNENSGGGISMYSQWHEFSTAGPGKLVGSGLRGLIDLGDGAPSFRDSPTQPFYVKVISDLDETGQTILLRGLDQDGKLIFTAPSTEGVSVVLDNAGVTTTQQFSELSMWIKSGVTNGVTRLYAIDVTTAVSTLIAIITPGKLVSGYRRYSVPWGCDRIEVIAKRAFVPAIADNDILIPGHLGALKLGMQAIGYENKDDLERAGLYWGPNEPERNSSRPYGAFDLLEQDRQEFDGDSVTPILQVMGDQGAGSVYNTM